MLPHCSSDYEGRDGQPLNAPISILLRVGFTGTRHVTTPPVGSYPTFPSLPNTIRRFISVALSLKSPSPDVIRHPCPVELGLSSPQMLAAQSLGLLKYHCQQIILPQFSHSIIVLPAENFLTTLIETLMPQPEHRLSVIVATGFGNFFFIALYRFRISGES